MLKLGDQKTFFESVILATIPYTRGVIGGNVLRPLEYGSKPDKSIIENGKTTQSATNDLLNIAVEPTCQ